MSDKYLKEVQCFLLISPGGEEVHHITAFLCIHLQLLFFQDDVKQSESSKDAPVLMQKLSSALPSSSLHLEELVTPTVAPATPSFDTESTATLITGSSFASNPQTNGHVASSVILIPPNNSGQVQSSDSINGLKERSPFEPVPTRGPEALISVLDTG